MINRDSFKPIYAAPFLSLFIFGTLLAAWLILPNLDSAALNNLLYGIVRSLIENIEPLSNSQASAALDAILKLLSCAGAITIFFLGSIYFTHQKNAQGGITETPISTRYYILGAYSILLFICGYILVVSSGVTYLEVMGHDTLIFYDGAYRLANGQIPHVDFHTPLGALCYLLPYIGLESSGHFAGSLESSSLLYLVFILAISVHVLSSRYTLLVSLIAISLLALVIIIPVSMGTPSLSHGMFYNRFSWVLVTVLLLFFHPPTTENRLTTTADIIAIGLSLAVLFYLKITYFAVALAFIPLLVINTKKYLLTALLALTLLILTALFVEIMFGLNSGYFDDIQTAIKSSGLVRYRFGNIEDVIPANLYEFIFTSIAIVLLYQYSKIRVSGILFIAFVVTTGILITNQNGPEKVILTLLAIILWTHEYLKRQDSLATGQHSQKPSKGIRPTCIIATLILLFAAQPLLTRITALSRLVIVTSQEQGEKAGYPDSLQGIRIKHGFNYFTDIPKDTDKDTAFNTIIRNPRSETLNQGEYMSTVISGYQLLKTLKIKNQSVTTFDLSNPFSVTASMRPANNDNSWFLANRNFSKTFHPAPKQLFKDIHYIMIPKFPMDKETRDLLLEIYSVYLTNNYTARSENRSWIIYSRNNEV